MSDYTAKQIEYISSVGGHAHISAVEIIGAIENQLTAQTARADGLQASATYLNEQAEKFRCQLQAQTARADALELKLELWNQEAVEHELIAQLRAANARADGLLKENIELKQAYVDAGIHDAGCDIGPTYDDPDYFGECNCSLLRYESELAALEDKP